MDNIWWYWIHLRWHSQDILIKWLNLLPQLCFQCSPRSQELQFWKQSVKKNKGAHFRNMNKRTWSFVLPYNNCWDSNTSQARVYHCLNTIEVLKNYRDKESICKVISDLIVACRRWRPLSARTHCPTLHSAQGVSCKRNTANPSHYYMSYIPAAAGEERSPNPTQEYRLVIGVKH